MILINKNVVLKPSKFVSFLILKFKNDTEEIC